MLAYAEEHTAKCATATSMGNHPPTMATAERACSAAQAAAERPLLPCREDTAATIVVVMRLLLLLVVLVVGCTGLDKKGTAEIPNPVGPINSAGKPDTSKTKGDLGSAFGSDPNLGGTPDVANVNAGGTPDPKKSHGKIGNVGAANSGGRPDASKSIPKKK